MSVKKVEPEKRELWDLPAHNDRDALNWVYTLINNPADPRERLEEHNDWIKRMLGRYLGVKE